MAVMNIHSLLQILRQCLLQICTVRYFFTLSRILVLILKLHSTTGNDGKIRRFLRISYLFYQVCNNTQFSNHFKYVVT